MIPVVRQGKKEITPAKEVILHSKNNLFVDLEVVQRSMVLFYNITVEGTLLRQLNLAVHSFQRIDSAISIFAVLPSCG